VGQESMHHIRENTILKSQFVVLKCNNLKLTLYSLVI